MQAMIVFDASTLILLAKAELLELFLAGSRLGVTIPSEVEHECYGRKKTLDALVIQKLVTDARIQVVSVGDRKLVAKLRADFSLGKGEAEAIALALNEKARLLGIDDKNGINACKLMGIPFATAVGILVRCLEKGLLGGPEALAKLDVLARYGRYKEGILEDARLKLEDRL
jgi:predicted nucleic acid-binding protein